MEANDLKMLNRALNQTIRMCKTKAPGGIKKSPNTKIHIDTTPCLAQAHSVYRINGAEYCKDCGQMMTENEFYYWETEETQATNEITMNDFIDNELPDDIFKVYLHDGTYAEMQEINSGMCWSVRAFGNGDFQNHKVQFDAIGYRQ